jgi:hypothetical protein
MRRLALALVAGTLAAYDAPVDTAGPLTVRLQPPAAGSYGSGGFLELSQPDTPLPLVVSLQNDGAGRVEGTLRLGVIDQWRAEPASLPFAMEPRSRLRREFTIRFGKGTYNAHYPVHAYAEFEYEGRRWTAHPILILTTRQPSPPRAPLPAAQEPAAVPERGSLSLWRLPARQERVVMTPEEPQAGATGQEVFDAAVVTRFGPRGITFVLGPRPPAGRERVESASVTYPLLLPRSGKPRLRFSGAGEATFRVRLEDRAVFERRILGEEKVEVDLAAGGAVRLTLESAEGTGEVQWIEPTIVTGAAPAGPAARSLGTAGGYEVRAGDVLGGPIELVGRDRRLAFQGFRVRAAGDAVDLLEAREEAAAGRYRVRHRMRHWAGNFDLVAELWADGEALQCRFWLENTPAPRPWLHIFLEEVAAGPWSERVRRVYGGPGNVLQEPQAFRLNFDGHSLATSFVGLEFANGAALVQAVDATPDRLEVDPGTRVASLVTPHAQTITFLPVANVWEGVKKWRERSGMRASAGVPKLAGRFVFDLWSGRYGAAAEALEQAFRYGLTDAVVVWHGWQRWGYDYRLPDIYPPNPQFGTEEEFRRLAEVCRKHGVLFAPHDNYIDFYPDAEGFSYEKIAFLPNGQPRRAWFHMNRGAQSYRFRADRVRPFVERNLRIVKQALHPTAWFIDVWSSIAPYDYWTWDGKFVERPATQREWGEAFAWIRDFLGDAPQISEAGHDRLIGWLDGAQANQLRVDPEARGFTWRVRAADAERIPWIDAAYHDRFILHGAGYQDRYAGGLDLKTHGMYSYDYMSTEVLSGRPAMAAQPFSRDVVRKYWLLHDAMRALALRKIEAVEFAGDDIHRQHVRWDSGAEVWVNRGASDWEAAGRVLPQYGFYVRAGKVEAAVEKRNGRVVEWSRSPEAVYEDGRRQTREGSMALPD